MVSVVVLVTELDLPSLDIHQLDFVGGTKTHIRALARADVANDRLDECAQISRRPVMHFEHNGSVAVVLYGHSFSEIVRGSHGSGDCYTGLEQLQAREILRIDN